ncbi:PH domain-containing protein [Amycolatopsis sp. OK19-0408]|uniref:PH domain-containing protein n=1 Tax=Amycolatopsis iheyensis TaxID=2945988 RepID=A0A9X2N6R8_9PSEU|nr:PH domain-containing protein [Amycolatopsis iheyensis]MCR6481832.1 PH domain-containing protein [Amycolatopsis iheyensis]
MSAGEIDLLPGERVLWAGEPVQRPLYVAADGVIAPAGLVLAVAALWFLLTTEPAGPAMAAAVVVLVIGLYGAVGREAVRYLALGRTTYAVTDSRVIARTGLFRQKERASELAGLSAPVLKPGPSRTGTLTFAESGSVTLMGVGEPKRVRDLLTKAIDEAKARQAPPEPDTSAA